MRKIEEAMCEAVKCRKEWKSGNTEVKNFSGTIVVYLHDNAIWQQNEFQAKHNSAEFTLAGWDTNTTRSRLRALGVDVCHVRGVPVYNGKEIEDERWYNV